MTDSPCKIKNHLEFSILAWCIALTFAPITVFSFFTSLVLAINGLNVFETEDPQLEIMTMLLASTLSPLLFFPLLRYATERNTLKASLSYIKLKKLRISQIFLVCVFALFLEMSIDGFSSLAGSPDDSFTIEIKKFLDSSYHNLALAVVSVCIASPLLEELTFRGWLYQRLASTKLGSAGAIGISSLLFTLFHFQYQEMLLLIALFIYSLILGCVRFKTGNTSYPVIIHMVSNGYALFAPIWFA